MFPNESNSNFNRCNQQQSVSVNRFFFEEKWQELPEIFVSWSNENLTWKNVVFCRRAKSTKSVYDHHRTALYSIAKAHRHIGVSRRCWTPRNDWSDATAREVRCWGYSGSFRARVIRRRRWWCRRGGPPCRVTRSPAATSATYRAWLWWRAKPTKASNVGSSTSDLWKRQARLSRPSSGLPRNQRCEFRHGTVRHLLKWCMLRYISRVDLVKKRKKQK